MESYSIRNAKPHEQRDLTRLWVRATLEVGYDDTFIERVMPSLTTTGAISLPLITEGAVQVAERGSAVVGVVSLTATMLQGIALLQGIFVDPTIWRHGVGRMLFEAAAARARSLKAGAIMIYAGPSAEGFYKRLGAIRIGEGPFVLSPSVTLPYLLYILPRDPCQSAKSNRRRGPGRTGFAKRT
jgi:GNAT superfamily N-acetyltransferase